MLQILEIAVMLMGRVKILPAAASWFTLKLYSLESNKEINSGGRNALICLPLLK